MRAGAAALASAAARSTLRCKPWSSGVLHDAVLDDVANEPGRQGLCDVEPDRALARAVSVECGTVSFHRRSAAREEGTVPGHRGVEHQHLAIETECGHPIADALFRLR